MGVPIEELDKIIDLVFHLNASSPPMLFKGGSLRPLMEWSFAAQLMYYSERVQHGEMRAVQLALKNAVSSQYIASIVGHGDIQRADDLIRTWGTAIQNQFRQDNLHLTTSAAHPNVEQMARVLVNQGQTVGALSTSLSLVQAEFSLVKSELVQVQRELSEIKDFLVNRQNLPAMHADIQDIHRILRTLLRGIPPLQ